MPARTRGPAWIFGITFLLLVAVVWRGFSSWSQPMRMLPAQVAETPPAPAAVQQFPDIPAGYPYAPAVVWARAQGLVSGYPDGTFRPDAPVLRGELLKMTSDLPGGVLVTVAPLFSDVPVDAWYREYLDGAVRRGIVSGYPDGTFRGGDPVTIVEAMKIFANAYALSPSEPVADSPWYQRFAVAIQEAGAFLPTFRDPGQHLTRGELAEMLHRLARRQEAAATEDGLRGAAPASSTPAYLQAASADPATVAMQQQEALRLLAEQMRNAALGGTSAASRASSAAFVAAGAASSLPVSGGASSAFVAVSGGVSSAAPVVSGPASSAAPAPVPASSAGVSSSAPRVPPSPQTVAQAVLHVDNAFAPLRNATQVPAVDEGGGIVVAADTNNWDVNFRNEAPHGFMKMFSLFSGGAFSHIETSLKDEVDSDRFFNGRPRAVDAFPARLYSLNGLRPRVTDRAGALYRRFPAPTSNFYGTVMVTSPGERYLVLASASAVKVFSLPDGAQVVPSMSLPDSVKSHYQPRGVNDAGEVLLAHWTSGGFEYQIFDIATGQLQTLSGDWLSSDCLVFSGDLQVAAGCEVSDTAPRRPFLVDRRTGAKTYPLAGTPYAFYDGQILNLSTDGRYLVVQLTYKESDNSPSRVMTLRRSPDGAFAQYAFAPDITGYNRLGCSAADLRTCALMLDEELLHLSVATLP